MVMLVCLQAAVIAVSKSCQCLIIGGELGLPPVIPNIPIDGAIQVLQDDGLAPPWMRDPCPHSCP